MTSELQAMPNEPHAIPSEPHAIPNDPQCDVRIPFLWSRSYLGPRHSADAAGRSAQQGNPPNLFFREHHVINLRFLLDENEHEGRIRSAQFLRALDIMVFTSMYSSN